MPAWRCRWCRLLWGGSESWGLLLAFLFLGRQGPPGEQSLPWVEGPAAAACPGSVLGTAGLVERPGPQAGGS